MSPILLVGANHPHQPLRPFAGHLASENGHPVLQKWMLITISTAQFTVDMAIPVYKGTPPNPSPPRNKALFTSDS